MIHLGKVTSFINTVTWGSGHTSKQASYSPHDELESQGLSFNKTHKFPKPLGTQLEYGPEPHPEPADCQVLNQSVEDHGHGELEVPLQMSIK